MKIIKRKDRKPQNLKGKPSNIKVSPARIAAFEILDKIKRMRSYSSILLPNYEKDLSAKDRGLCHEIVLGVLRKKIFLDAVIKKFTKDKILDDEIITALRIGIYQMLFLDKIPEYSAINESVNLAKRAGKKSASGLVNAVLRSVQRHGEFNFKFDDAVERIVFETSHPRLLVEKWIGEFGIEEAEKIATANNEISRPTFRFTRKFYCRNAEAQKEILESLSEDISNSENVKDAFVAERMNETMLQLAQNGEIYFQEEASQMVADAVKIGADEKFLDLCAAPGSKTSFIAAKFQISNFKFQNKDEFQNQNRFQISNFKFQNKDESQITDDSEILNLKFKINENQSAKSKEQKTIQIVAGDYYAHRIENLKLNLENQAAEFVDIVQYDAMLELPFADETFDVILIDAPCSGTGTIRHNPEIRYFLRAEDFEMLSGKQLEILNNASKILKTGGRLIYSTCSLEIEENETVIEKFLIDNTNFKKIVPNIAEKFLTEDDFGRTFPHRNSTDGFFIAMLERI